jgi:ABC-type polysaccharide/polyol phosphate export permease
MLSHFGTVWGCRHFWISLVNLDLRTRYRRSLLGIGWSLVNPIAMTAILCLVFHKLFNQSIIDFAPHVFAGLACWNYLTHCVLQGCQSFFIGESYIRQFPLPISIYPLRTVLGASFHFLVALGVVVVGVSVLGILGYRHVNPMALLSLIPAVGMWFCLCWSVSVLAAVANVFFQDTQHLLEIGFQILFYATPIMYQPRLLEEHGLGWLTTYNPVYVFLRLIREPILEGVVPSVSTYATGLLIILAVSGLASALVARFQKTLIFHL